ncbi:MAG: DPP IV N-terminal domain-containing protein, partial [Planctomycetota bacterium]
LNEGSEYPILRIENPLELSIDKINQINQLGSLTLDMIGGTFSILDSVPTPKWLEGNQIEMSLYGRSFAMDAESVSFVAPRPQNYQSSQIAEQLVELGVDQEQANELSRIKPIESENRHWLVFDGDQSDFIYDVRNKKVRLIGTLESSAELFTFSPNQEQLAFVKEDVLSWIDVENNQRYRLSVEQQTDQLFGKLDWVYQEELYGRGNFKGYWFSPDSKYLAFLMLDETDVGKFTISDHIPVRGKDEFLSYPKAGDSNPTVKLGLVSTSNPNRVNWINLGSYAEQEILIANVSWRPDSSQLVFQLQNREQTFLDLLAVEPDKSQPTLLFRDETPAWIDSPGEPKWLSNGSFVWLSPRNGYKHLYHCNPDGSVKRQLTSGPWEVREVAEFDPANGLIYFISAKDEPTELHAYRLDVVSGEIIKITSEPGTHRVAFNASKTMLIDSFSTATQPTSHQLKKSNGEFLRVLNASSDDRIQYVGLQEPKYFEIESSNDQPLDAMLIYPPDFDPNQKYPVLIHTYAGPQAPQVRNRFGGSWALWHQCLAQQGYVVFKCDNQSASYRSVKNAWPIHRDLGRRELADIELGVAWLKKQSWVDSARIGIWGWSYGGYMTAYALTHSESFKIGISGAPVTDWRNYDTIYTERYMGLPQTNQIGYEASSVVKAAGQLRGKLLLIHGSIDDNVHLSNSMQFAMELQQAGKQFELMIYPKNRHGIRRPEQAKHLRRLMFEFVLENL